MCEAAGWGDQHPVEDTGERDEETGEAQWISGDGDGQVRFEMDE